jgi:hypothetical protein
MQQPNVFRPTFPYPSSQVTTQKTIFWTILIANYGFLPFLRLIVSEFSSRFLPLLVLAPGPLFAPGLLLARRGVGGDTLQCSPIR